MSRPATGAIAIALVFVAGCGGKAEPATAPGTGAREAVETFYSAIIANDPTRAYSVLDPDGKRRLSADQFAALARAYLKNVGFTVEKFNARSCDEQGDAATAHIVLSGHSAGHSRRHNDGITLRRAGGQWGIVLPNNFGQKAR